MSDSADAPPPRPPRRKRYGGKNPQRYDEKYKEHRGDAETLAKVVASGKTAAGTHRPIMVEEILRTLKPQNGQSALDATLGFGGHTEALLGRLLPGGRLVGLDADARQLPLTVDRLRLAGFTEPAFQAVRSNFAGAPKVLATLGWEGVDMVLADLGVSSMQIDNPARGFSYKHDGPLDMRMNPERGQTAGQLLKSVSVRKLAQIMEENADEPNADRLAEGLAGGEYLSTSALKHRVVHLLGSEPAEAALPRVFQALRIAVNEEFTALETLLRALPEILRPKGRVAILTFHSGEDRRVKKAFQTGLAEGFYSAVATDVTRASAAEIFHNPRASSAKLRWAVRR